MLFVQILVAFVACSPLYSDVHLEKRGLDGNPRSSVHSLRNVDGFGDMTSAGPDMETMKENGYSYNPDLKEYGQYTVPPGEDGHETAGFMPIDPHTSPDREELEKAGYYYHPQLEEIGQITVPQGQDGHETSGFMPLEPRKKYPRSHQFK